MTTDEIINRAAKEIRQHTGIPPGWHGWGWEEQERRFDAVLAAIIHRAVAEAVKETGVVEACIMSKAYFEKPFQPYLGTADPIWHASKDALTKLRALTEIEENKS